MNLYSIYTEEEAVLKDIFVKSIKDPWQVNTIYWGRLGGNVQDWGTDAFVKLMRRRIEFLVETIQKEMGHVIIWSDIDIQFFGPCSAAIEKTLKDNDLLFLAEHWPKKEINAGFVVIRCNEKTQAFYEAVLKMDFEKLPYHDQSAVNQLLMQKTIDLKWDILPHQFWAKSHGGPAPKDILVHHANTTFPCVRDGKKISSLELKLEQLAEVKGFVSAYPSWKWHWWGKWRFWAKALVYGRTYGKI
jgi:hypothetical protein